MANIFHGNTTFTGNFTLDDAINKNSNASMWDMKEPWKFRSQEECTRSWAERSVYDDGRRWCNATWDTVLCWPSVPAGNTVYLPCPPLPGLDASQKGFRKCGLDGRWEGGRQPIGYTNYTFCYTPESRKLLQKFFGNKTGAELQMMNDIIVGTRTMEIIGLWLSLVSSLISLFIFSYFRSLRCNRTRIHRNLLIAIIVQTVIRLVLYLDQYIAKQNKDEGGLFSSKEPVFHMSIICEIIYTLLEYTKSVQFMWMLIEGLYLHNMIAITVFSSKPNYLFYYILGWVSPVPFIIVWGTTTFGPDSPQRCWFPYYLEPYQWIVDAPRVAIMAVNLMFLLNIIRVLIKKLRKSHTQEPQVTKVRKAVKAALVLLPLLGITNFVVMIEPPSDSVVNFGICTYTTHFLVSFQGFFISLLYCFLNGEVQMAIRKTLAQFRQNQMYTDSNFRRLSRSLSIFTSVTEVPNSLVGQQRRSSNINGSANAVPLLRDIVSKSESRL